jgi:Ca-activated chloride channel family protein
MNLKKAAGMNSLRFTIILIGYVAAIGHNLVAQNVKDVETEIASDNDYELSVIRVYPDSFPQVSVIFQAQNQLGMPIWEMGSDELSITENSLDCEIIRIRNISKNRPVNIGLVLDASGSMAEVSESELEELFGQAFRDSAHYYWRFRDYDEKPWKDPLDHAKAGLKSFLTEETLGKDSLQLVVFSQQVLSTVSLTANAKSIIDVIDTVMPFTNTAFYDALIGSMNMLPQGSSETVLVALTDGNDNQSVSNDQDVIKLANQRNVKIYIIGLGFVNAAPLELIAENTGGFFHYTDKPEQLTEIYRNIKKQIRSVYQVDYVSAHEDTDVTNMDIRFSFVNDTLQFLNNEIEYQLPAEAVEYIRQQEKQRQTRNVLLAIGVIGLVGLTVFFFKRRRKKKELAITKVYPNPFSDSFYLDYEVDAADSVITDVTLLDAGNQPIPIKWLISGNRQILVEVNNTTFGIHFAMVHTAANSSKPIKILRRV